MTLESLTHEDEIPEDYHSLSICQIIQLSLTSYDNSLHITDFFTLKNSE